MPSPSITTTMMVSGDMSQSSLTSDALSIEFSNTSCVQAFYTGSPVGTLSIQATIDGNHWSTIDGSSVSVSSSGDTTWNLVDMAPRALRVVWTKNSGTGNLFIIGCCKGVSY